MGLANTLRHEIDDAGELLTGEDAIEWLLESAGWEKAQCFSRLHNALVTGAPMKESVPHKRGAVTGNPLYRKEDLQAWCQAERTA